MRGRRGCLLGLALLFATHDLVIVTRPGGHGLGRAELLFLATALSSWAEGLVDAVDGAEDSIAGAHPRAGRPLGQGNAHEVREDRHWRGGPGFT